MEVMLSKMRSLAPSILLPSKDTIISLYGREGMRAISYSLQYSPRPLSKQVTGQNKKVKSLMMIFWLKSDPFFYVVSLAIWYVHGCTLINWPLLMFPLTVLLGHLIADFISSTSCLWSFHHCVTTIAGFLPFFNAILLIRLLHFLFAVIRSTSPTIWLPSFLFSHVFYHAQSYTYAFWLLWGILFLSMSLCSNFLLLLSWF